MLLSFVFEILPTSRGWLQPIRRIGSKQTREQQLPFVEFTAHAL
jgi:hypothetical protein